MVPAAGTRNPLTVCFRENSAKHKNTMAMVTVAASIQARSFVDTGCSMAISPNWRCPRWKSIASCRNSCRALISLTPKNRAPVSRERGRDCAFLLCHVLHDTRDAAERLDYRADAHVVVVRDVFDRDVSDSHD